MIELTPAAQRYLVRLEVAANAGRLQQRTRGTRLRLRCNDKPGLAPADQGFRERLRIVAWAPTSDGNGGPA